MRTDTAVLVQKYKNALFAAAFSVCKIPQDAEDAVQEAFKTIFTGDIGAKISGIFVAICLTFFAFSTIISWNLFGKINMEYLFGKKSSIIYSIIAIGFIFLGSCLSNDLVWELTDTFNGLMVLPNAIALIALSGLVVCVKRSKGKRSVDSLQNEGNDTDK